MEERPREWGSAGYELPPETEGWESKIEKAKEGTTGQDSPSIDQKTPTIITAPSPNPPSTATIAAVPATVSPLLNVAGSEEEFEKRSAEKAKQIIASTSDDPHAQKEQISQLKAEYLKARFNKDLRLKEAA